MGIGVLESWKVTVVAGVTDCALAVVLAVFFQAAFYASGIFVVFRVKCCHLRIPPLDHA